MTNKAYVHHCSWSEGEEIPFLFPSALRFYNARISCAKDPNKQYPEGGLYHLKSALVKVALAQVSDPVLTPFQRVQEHTKGIDLTELVESCAVYFLARAFQDIRKQLKQRLPDFGDQVKDYLAINMAVPVENAEQCAVNDMFMRIFNEAWNLSKSSGLPSEAAITELRAIREDGRRSSDPSSIQSCFLYPEVSANVQGFVRSRVSSPGIYLFSDTGGGSVDQSIFIFLRQVDGLESLTYLTGRVYALGSSHIERLAAERAKQSGWKALESWREKKERGDSAPELVYARSMVDDELARRTESTLFSAKKKLYVKDQLATTRLVFGGGGHCEHPYQRAVLKPFEDGRVFPRSIKPDVIGLPLPRDLELDGHGNFWMRRLYVAYGLSFERSELARFTYPKDVSTPEPDEIWQRFKRNDDFPGKDVC